MAKEKIHCSKCNWLVAYEAKELKIPEVSCSACGTAIAVEARAVARYIRMAPRKLRLVADAVRGKTVNDALVFLRFAPRRAAKVMSKVVASAKANAENTYKMDPENLVVSGVLIDGGPVFKRFMPRAQGRAALIRKRTSHITVRVRELGQPVKVEKAQPAEKAPAVKSKPTARRKTKEQAQTTKAAPEKKKRVKKESSKAKRGEA